MTDIDMTAVQALLDKQSISELLMRYSRSIDRRDWDLTRSVYWPEATDEHLLYKGGVSGFIELAASFVVDMPTMHFLGNILIDLQSVTSAFSETYFMAYHDMPGEERKNLILWGRYLDSHEKREGQWKISSRTLALDAYSLTPTTSVWDETGLYFGITTRGGAKPDDPLYRLHPRGVDA